MKIISFQKGLKIIKKQIKNLNQNSISEKKEFLNSVILESLNESEREKEQILNSLVEQVSYLDLDYKLQWINEAGLKSIPSEVSISSVLGRHCYEIWHDRTLPCESCPVTTTLKTVLALERRG